MAQIDASIPLDTKAPDIAGGIQKAYSMVDLGMKTKEDMQGFQDQQDARAALKNNVQQNPDGTSSINRQGMLSDLYKANPGAAMKAQQQFNAQDLQNSEAQLNLAHQRVTFGSQIMGTVTDQPSYDDAKQKLVAAGMADQVSKMPQAFDAGYVTRAQQAGIAMQQKIENTAKQQGLTIQQQEADAKTSEAATKAKTAVSAAPKVMDQYSKDFYTQNKSDIDALKKYGDAQQAVKDSDGAPAGANLAQMEFVKAAMSRATQKEIEMADANPGAMESFARKMNIAITNKDTASNQAFWNKMLSGAKDQTLSRLSQSADDYADAKGQTNPNVSAPMLANALKTQHVSRFQTPGSSTPGAGPHPQDDAALGWARQNKSDPRAAAILKANGVSQ